MIWIVVTANLLLSFLLLWVTWRVWCLRFSLRAATESILRYAFACQQGLFASPPAVMSAAKGVAKLRQRSQTLAAQLQRVLFILNLVGRLRFLAQGKSGGKR